MDVVELLLATIFALPELMFVLKRPTVVVNSTLALLIKNADLSNSDVGLAPPLTAELVALLERFVRMAPALAPALARLTLAGFTPMLVRLSIVASAKRTLRVMPWLPAVGSVSLRMIAVLALMVLPGMGPSALPILSLPDLALVTGKNSVVICSPGDSGGFFHILLMTIVVSPLFALGQRRTLLVKEAMRDYV